MGAWFAIGISALATLLLKGPTIPATSASPISDVTFCAPTDGSWAPLGPTSSLATNASLYPGIAFDEFASSIAICAPFSVGFPLAVSLPEVGRSVAILMVVELVAVEEPPVPLVVPEPQ